MEPNNYEIAEIIKEKNFVPKNVSISLNTLKLINIFFLFINVTMKYLNIVNKASIYSYIFNEMLLYFFLIINLFMNDIFLIICDFHSCSVERILLIGCSFKEWILFIYCKYFIFKIYSLFIVVENQLLLDVFKWND